MQREAFGRVLRLLDRGCAVGLPFRLGAPSGIALVPGDAGKPTLPFNYRYSSSQQDDQAGRESKRLLEGIHGALFQQELEHLRQKHSSMPFASLVNEFVKSVPGASLEEASRACEAMTVAGTVLRHGAVVYLRPAEVLATINKVLPFNQEDIKNRLKEVDMNLGALEAKYAEITRGVKMRTVVINYALLAGLAAQWGILFRLTYWELSWDVMEPVGFFIGGCSSLLSFAWFLRTQRDFSYESMHKRFMSGYERRAFEKANFNVQEFNRLKQERARLLSLLQCNQVNQVDVAQ